MSETSFPKLHCVFYSHPWTALQLKSIHALDFTGSLIIEVSTQGVLSQMLGKKPHKSEHLGQLLGSHEPKTGGLSFGNKKTILEKIAQKNEHFPAPLILATPELCPLNQTAATLLAFEENNAYRQLILLLHYQEAPAFSTLYGHVDGFHILWDIADLPTLALNELTEMLQENFLHERSRWGGFHICNHPQRPVTDEKERRAFFDSVIGEYLSEL